jgi:Zn-dependent membrane protease YugP
MHILILLLVVFALVVGPGIWVKSVMRRYSEPRDRYAKTGGEFARDLLDSLALANVRTEATTSGDHYDPMTKTVRLARDNFDGRSLTAIAVAAHEVGHALQDARGFAPLRWRTRLVQWISPIEKLGAGMLMLSPLTAAATQSRAIGVLTLGAGMLTLGSSVLVHLLTLPTELDASFGRALPLMRDRGLLRTGDGPRARQLLTAAAFTYVAAALQSLLNIARWWAILRR